MDSSSKLDDPSSTGSVMVVRTGMRSEYFCLILSASALRFSKGCSSLNLERISTAGYLLELELELVLGLVLVPLYGCM